MIRVTVELVSANGAHRDRLLGVAEIDNQGTANVEPRFHRYMVKLSKWAPKERETWMRGAMLGPNDAEIGEVPEFDRVYRGAWDLLYLALKAVVGSRNP